MKDRFILALFGIVVILLMTLVLPIYLIYSLLVSIIDFIHTFLQGCADYFETVRDCLKGKF